MNEPKYIPPVVFTVDENTTLREAREIARVLLDATEIAREAAQS
jgi:hypothetical protein